jgi:hypothetical protein
LNIDAHREEGGIERRTSCTPQKTSKIGSLKCNKTQKRGHPPRFSHNPSTPSKEFENDCVKFLQSHPPITETLRFCLIVYLYNMFQPSAESSSGTNELNYKNDFSQFQKLIKKFNKLS